MLQQAQVARGSRPVFNLSRLFSLLELMPLMQLALTISLAKQAASEASLQLTSSTFRLYHCDLQAGKKVKATHKFPKQPDLAKQLRQELQVPLYGTLSIIAALLRCLQTTAHFGC